MKFLPNVPIKSNNYKLPHHLFLISWCMCKLVISFTSAYSHPFFPYTMTFFLQHFFPIPFTCMLYCHSSLPFFLHLLYIQTVSCAMLLQHFFLMSTSSVSTAKIHQLAFMYTHQIAFVTPT